jgi:hypothetical protein
MVIHVIYEAFCFKCGKLCDGKGQLERHERRWEDNIKIDLQEIEWEEARTGSIWLRIGTGGGHT